MREHEAGPGVPLRVGSVPYVNARPLFHFMASSNPDDNPPIDLTFEVPSKLTRTMGDGQLDAALLPSIEYFRAGGDYEIIPDISISADGSVESVRIFSRTDVANIRSLALDKSSRTSAALASIIMKRKLGFLPEITTCSPEQTLDDVDADAMLLIGDSTMAFDAGGAAAVLDLGEEWKKLTGLPFVYAMWVVRKDLAAGPLTAKLITARDLGLSRLSEVAEKGSSETGLDVEMCLRYLRDIMRYGLAAPEVDALKLFQKLAAEDGLCEGGLDIVFAD
jgi:chorismate dehydratase